MKPPNTETKPFATADVLVRRLEPNEENSVRGLVRAVAEETFRDLFAPSPVPFEEQEWSGTWVAVSRGKIVGVVLTREDWISDLWVAPESRGRGLGQRLLSQAETEIAVRGFGTSRLRVVKSNSRALQFYLRQGWSIAREFPHEKFHHAMLEMHKAIRNDPLLIRRYRSTDREAIWALHEVALKAVGAYLPGPEGARFNADLDEIEHVYVKNGGEFLVGLIGERIVAMGALKRVGKGVAEITRMRVHPEFWRRGYGEAIFRRLESAATDSGYSELWLDTLPRQVAAQILYRKNGFQEYCRAYIRGYDAEKAILFRKIRRLP
jgi:ribosomal protein S18 acetylase RimI-like enzyme